MPTTPIYDYILKEVTDQLEKRILSALIGGDKVTRPQLIMKLFGVYIPPSALASSLQDRKIREAIEHLRQSGWPIVSSSGAAGYSLVDDEDQIRAFAAEQEARAHRNQQAAKAAYSWLPKARAIKEARKTGQSVTQGRLL